MIANDYHANPYVSVGLLMCVGLCVAAQRVQAPASQPSSVRSALLSEMRGVLEQLGPLAPRYRDSGWSAELAEALRPPLPGNWCSVSVPRAPSRAVCAVPEQVVAVRIGENAAKIVARDVSVFYMAPLAAKAYLEEYARDVARTAGVPRSTLEAFLAKWRSRTELDVRRAMVQAPAVYRRLQGSDVRLTELFECAVFVKLLGTFCIGPDIQCVQEVRKGRTAVFVWSSDFDLLNGKVEAAVYQVFVDGAYAFSVEVNPVPRHVTDGAPAADEATVTEVRRSVLKLLFEAPPAAGDNDKSKEKKP